MGYKTVAVHLNHEARAHRLLGVGIELARRHDAHLIGLHVIPSLRFAPAMPLPFGAQVAQRIHGGFEQADAHLRAIFEEATRNQPFAAAWRSILSRHRDPAATVCAEAHAADIVVTSQADPGWALSDTLDFPDRLALGVGRPVLVVPNFGEHIWRRHGLPRIITLAWSGGREAARAVADAMPLLQGAETVYLLTVGEGGVGGGLGADGIEKALFRQGVHVVAARVPAADLTVGEEIRVRALEHRADLLVMGCYGHSRLRETALGGVTRHMLREMTLPVLLSH